ncbi:hypothetical protein Barb7_03127 [Bacteroidales bacterium Barb7]|nr:hypothetical protein Barb7_03127 [Bacteroidales bacterium Barb7]
MKRVYLANKMPAGNSVIPEQQPVDVFADGFGDGQDKLGNGCTVGLANHCIVFSRHVQYD